MRIYSYSDAAALINEEAMIESSASDENDASLRSRKDAGISATHQIPSPLRRHHLKFGVLGKRYSYGYLGKRTDGMIFLVFCCKYLFNYFFNLVPHNNNDFEEWVHDMRERRGGRPQYGMLG